MPWKEMSVMSQRREFVELAQAAGTNKRGLCRRFGISPTTGYKWLGRFCERSDAGLVDLPRRPHHSPARTPPQVEQAVMSAREAHPAWGARKPESTEGGRLVSILKWPEGAPLNLG